MGLPVGWLHFTLKFQVLSFTYDRVGEMPFELDCDETFVHGRIIFYPLELSDCNIEANMNMVREK
jgi:hypothetical protein